MWWMALLASALVAASGIKKQLAKEEAMKPTPPDDRLIAALMQKELPAQMTVSEAQAQLDALNVAIGRIRGQMDVAGQCELAARPTRFAWRKTPENCPTMTFDELEAAYRDLVHKRGLMEQALGITQGPGLAKQIVGTVISTATKFVLP